MNRYLRFVFPLVLAAAPVLAAAASVSTASATRSQPLPPAQPPAQVSDATLIKFIKATDAIRVVRKGYAPKVTAASTQTAKTALRQQERFEMRKEVVKFMPVREYLQLERQIRHDPQLKARVRKLVQEHQQSAGNTSSSATGQIDDVTLQKFLKAAAAVRSVRAEYRPKIAAASDAAAKTQLKEEARKAAGSAVSKYMSVSEFMQIEKRMRTDPALRARAKAMVHKARAGAAASGSSG